MSAQCTHAEWGDRWEEFDNKHGVHLFQCLGCGARTKLQHSIVELTYRVWGDKRAEVELSRECRGKLSEEVRGSVAHCASKFDNVPPNSLGGIEGQK
jgi:hypothetical protein